ncbi:hypothetical protein [Bacillus sp. V59.32b]|uniref:hypothetical protein n=1 Tax=Bacillus sp. V59.32b TaxID=1758642 RepID=UPI000E3C2A09|nr:hypothetical protein [Bacillus sp. V59.32b]RFU61508.1 hypothetical protein D0463_15015 [Bacillus sp. V59.32b]
MGSTYKYDDMLTTNEIKDLLGIYISPFKEMEIKSNVREVTISKTKAINLLCDNLSKEQLNDLLLQLELVSKKNLDDYVYMKYILTGVLDNQGRHHA